MVPCRLPANTGVPPTTNLDAQEARALALSYVVSSSPSFGGGVPRRGFGELEAVIMDYLWSQDGPRTVREMHTALSSARSSAYTTVSTVVDNLHKKGWLRRQPADRQAFRYLPVASRGRVRRAADAGGTGQLR